ncbi:serine/threonine-protein kinase [Spirillospora sp. CA-128828]|uniref:serine/threonine-protein kinase n=1 Tax=Spirillospora sp. CA-128828 TaxID=3240033 RepID=UPI003D8B9F3D
MFIDNASQVTARGRNGTVKPRPGQVLNRRYKLVKVLGQGGMGQVWSARDLELERPVAIKVVVAENVPPSAIPELIARLRREAKTAGRLQHPGITAVYDIGEDDGSPYVVMELLDGRSFRELVAGSPEGLPVDQVMELAIKVADALAYAHDRGLVHRDIKPANLMALSGGGVKICDFGISRLPDTTTITGRGVPGTPGFIAPEQFNGVVAPRADMYSLGCTLHVLLTGEQPSSNSPDDVSQGLVSARPDIPSRLKHLLLRLLAADPAERPDAAMLRDLLTALRSGRDEPVRARSLPVLARQTGSDGHHGDTSPRPSPGPGGGSPRFERPASPPRATTRREPPDPDLFAWPEIREPRPWIVRAAMVSAPAWFLIIAGQIWYQLPGDRSIFGLFCLIFGTYSLGAMAFSDWEYSDRRSSAGNGDELPSRPGLAPGLLVGLGLLVAAVFYGVRVVIGAGDDRWLMLLWTMTGLVAFTTAFTTRWIHSYESGMKSLGLGNWRRYQAIAETMATTVWFGEPYEDPLLPGIGDLLAELPAARFFRLQREHPFPIAAVCGPKVLLISATTWPPGIYRDVGYKEVLRDGRSCSAGVREIGQLDAARRTWAYEINKSYQEDAPKYSDVEVVLVVGRTADSAGEVVLGDGPSLSIFPVRCTTPAGFTDVVRSHFQGADRIDLPTVARVLDYYDWTQGSDQNGT